MFIYADEKMLKESHLAQPPVPIRQISFLPRQLPWIRYPYTYDHSYEISFIINGNGQLMLPGTVLPLSQGQITILPPGTAHYFCKTEDERTMEYYVLLFDREESNPTSLQARLQGLEVSTTAAPGLMLAIEPVLLAVFQIADQRNKRLDRISWELIHPLLELTAEEFIRSGRRIQTTVPMYADDILHYLQQNICRKVTMEDLSRIFHLSPSHISRIFMNTYHTSPIHYLIYCRMRQARTYILDQHLSAREIASRLAFHNTNHFIQTFEKFYGCHPDRYLTDAPEFRNFIEPPLTKQGEFDLL